MAMKILVVGGGGREHAISRALSLQEGVEISSVMYGRNPGIARLASHILIEKETNVRRIVEFATGIHVDLAIIGPEAPLEAGISDALEDAGIGCAGPSRSAARLETDKAFCREMMQSHGIAGCPRYRVFHDEQGAINFVNEYTGDLAIKPIGLTGGKGVRIIGEQIDRGQAIAYIRSLHGQVVLEERLIGEEFTLQAFADGHHLIPMPLVQDHKRAFEGDTGPNTGGMGSYSMGDHLLPFVGINEYEQALQIMKDAVNTLYREGYPFRGILYGQFMNTKDGPKVVEFNARFGDPEAMNVLSILRSDFAEILCQITEGTLSRSRVLFDTKATVCKYLVPQGYPETPVVNAPLTIGDYQKALLYYANVEEKDGVLFTQSSRTLAFVGIGDTLEEAEAFAESGASSVLGHVRHRKDIGTHAL
ncbi:MAG: phosphoribosylamine--glycine ligase, partial [Methanomicrobiales archaeon]|nr:phosphoribosylamine--glycine ligase [Methanomicrobiales archaeon]